MGPCHQCDMCEAGGIKLTLKCMQIGLHSIYAALIQVVGCYPHDNFAMLCTPGQHTSREHYLRATLEP